MKPDNIGHLEPAIFSALITPHRSLDRVGFMVLMGLVSFVSFIAGIVFLIAGAWPVLGFFGLDVALLYWAFRVNYAAAAAYEEVIVTLAELKVRKVSHLGEMQQWTLNPLWVKLGRETDEQFGITKLFLEMRGDRLTIASFLGPNEKASFAKSLEAALHEAKRGPARTVV